MNWLERARREIGGTVNCRTANTDETDPTAVMAGLALAGTELAPCSFGSNGSVVPMPVLLSEALGEAYEERAAIMQFDGGLSRDDAERSALALVIRQRRLH